MRKRDTPLPNNLVELLKAKMAEIYSGKLEDGFLYHLNINIDFLIAEGIINKKVTHIGPPYTNEIWREFKGNIEYGGFTPDIIKNPLMRKPYLGNKKVIKALIIAAFAKQWKVVFNEYYDQNGNLKKNETNPLRKENPNGSRQLTEVLNGNSIIPIDSLPPTNFSYNENNFNVLLLPFYNPEHNGELSHLGIELRRRISENDELSEAKVDVKYYPYNEFDFTTKMAFKVGEGISNTNIVIWGTDSKLEDKPHQICFHYVIPQKLNDNDFIPLKGKTRMLEISRLAEITEGEIQLEIEEVIYWLLANNYFLRNDYHSCIKYLLKILNEQFINDSFYIILADCYQHIHEYDKSKDYYEKGLQKNPKNFRGLNNYGILLSDVYGKLEESIKCFKKVIKLFPGSPRGYANYAFSLAEKKQEQQADRYMEKALRVAPNSPETYSMYARYLSEIRNNYNKAYQYYKHAVELDPTNWGLNDNYRLFVDENSEFLNDQKSFYEDLLIKYNDSWALQLSYANLLFYTENDVKKSIIHYEKAINLKPEKAPVHYYYAGCLTNLNDFDKANEHFEKALQISPNNGKLAFIYSYFLRVRLKLNAKADEYYKKAIKLDKSLIGLPRTLF